MDCLGSGVGSGAVYEEPLRIFPGDTQARQLKEWRMSGAVGSAIPSCGEQTEVNEAPFFSLQIVSDPHN